MIRLMMTNKLWWAKNTSNSIKNYITNNSLIISDNIEGRLRAVGMLEMDQGNISGITNQSHDIQAFLSGSNIEYLQVLIRQYNIKVIDINRYNNTDRKNDFFMVASFIHTDVTASCTLNYSKDITYLEDLENYLKRLPPGFDKTK